MCDVERLERAAGRVEKGIGTIVVHSWSYDNQVVKPCRNKNRERGKREEGRRRERKRGRERGGGIEKEGEEWRKRGRNRERGGGIEKEGEE